MTVIATFAIGGYPVLFGDLLVTGPSDNRDTTIAVPARGEVQDFFGASGWAVMGLNQKVTVLTHNCVTAWAGSWLGARIAIAGLRELANTNDLTCENVLQYLNREPELRRHSASFVGLTRELGGIRQFWFNADHFLSPSLGNVYLSGSGSSVIHEFSNLLGEAEVRATGSPNVAANAIARTLMLGGLLLQTEFRGGDGTPTLRNMFGGGYEIAFYSNEQFHKLGEVTYIFWEAALYDEGVKMTLPQLIVKQKYLGDFLLIRSARVEVPNMDTAPRVVDEQRHVISPMFEASLSVEPGDLETVSLQSNLLCHCILVRHSNQMSGIYTRVQRYSPTSERTITFEDKDDQIVFGFRSDTMLEIGKALEQFRANGSRG